MKKIIAAFILALATPCIAQTDVNKFFSGTSEGMTYFLPDTKICITVEACCVTRTPGEFSSYAERFLHIKDAIAEPGNSWEIVGVESCCEGIPCKDKAYTVKLNGSTASNISLNDKGIIEAINTTMPAKSIEERVAAKQNTGKHIDASQYMTEEMLTATSTAKMAELTAKEIYTIRESKLAITRGLSENTPSDGAGITFLLQELDKQERALTEMFTGRTDTLYHTYNYEFIPSSACDTVKAVLFRFSRKLGVLDKENLAGEPVYYDIKNLRTVVLPTENETAANKKSIKKEGVCYNIPGRARMEIYTRSRTFIKKEIAIAQLGTTEVLSKTLFGKNNTTKVLFDTATGGVISIKKD